MIELTDTAYQITVQEHFLSDPGLNGALESGHTNDRSDGRLDVPYKSRLCIVVQWLAMIELASLFLGGDKKH